MKKTKISARRAARIRVVQALYQWQLSPATTEEEKQVIVARYFSVKISDDDKQLALEQAALPLPFDRDYSLRLWEGIMSHYQVVDERIKAHIDRSMASLTAIELAVLRLSAYELLYEKDVPFKVVINEALEITKCYGTELGYKYVNAVLDALKKSV